MRLKTTRYLFNGKRVDWMLNTRNEDVRQALPLWPSSPKTIAWLKVQPCGMQT